MSETMNKEMTEEIIIQTELKTFLNDVADHRFGYRLGDPWKYSEESLGVVVPILRDNAPERQYITMYEVLKDLNIKDTGGISQVELQNQAGMPVFIRAGTIFTGSTQNRAAQHSGIYAREKETVDVRCVHHSHGISRGASMKFGDIAPASVTMNLMSGNQDDVWDSVESYTSGDTTTRRRRYGAMPLAERVGFASMSASASARSNNTRHFMASTRLMPTGFRADNLLGHLQEKQAILDDMMQKVPLFPDQVGAIIFGPVGVLAVEMFDSPKSWEAIKKEVIEKWGDKINEKQAEHLFELKPEVIPQKFRDFINKLAKVAEITVRKDNYSETRTVQGEGIIGEYTIVKGQPIHVLLLKEENN